MAAARLRSASVYHAKAPARETKENALDGTKQQRRHGFFMQTTTTTPMTMTMTMVSTSSCTELILRCVVEVDIKVVRWVGEFIIDVVIVVVFCQYPQTE